MGNSSSSEKSYLQPFPNDLSNDESTGLFNELRDSLTNNLNSSNNFEILDDEKTEKSIHSYKIILKTTNQRISTFDENVDKTRYMNKKTPGMICKLKFYPSYIGFKNKEHIFQKYSYYDVLGWGASRDIFYFETKEKIYFCIMEDTNGYIVAKDIIEICKGILEKIKKIKKMY